MRENRHKFKDGCVHSFTGSKEEMLALVEMGMYIGVNGCSLKTEENIEVVKAIPLEKMMLESKLVFNHSSRCPIL